MRGAGWRLCGWLLVLVALGGVAAAEGAAPAADDDLARRHFDAGTVLYQRKDWDGARREFLESLRLNPTPELVFDLCQLEKAAGRLQDALSYCRRFVDERPGDLDGWALLEALQAQMQQRGQRAVRIPPLRAEPEVVPAAVPLALAPPAAPMPRPGRPRLRLRSLGLVVPGLALLVVGIGLGGAASAAARQLEDPQNIGRTFDGALRAELERGHQVEAAGIALDALGGAAGAAGVAWLVWDLRRRGRQP